MTKNDTVIILSDFGLVWDCNGENKTEKYWLDWLEKKHMHVNQTFHCEKFPCKAPQQSQ